MARKPQIVLSSLDVDRIEALIAAMPASVFPGKVELQAELDRADVVAPEEIPPNVVTMNSTVKFLIVETGKEFCLTLVYPRDTAQGAPTGPVADAIASAAKRLNELRENWLNPPEWVDWVITPEEETAGFPKRPVAKPGKEAELKKRTLTNLYNQRPAWLDNAHRALDAAVAAAYGWSDYTWEMPDEEILRRLLALNLARAAQQAPATEHAAPENG